MTITCSKCEKRFRFAKSRVPKEGLSLICSSCGHRFLFKPEEAPSPAPIRSLLEDDPDLLDIVQQFADRVPERIRLLQELQEKGEHEELQRIAHQLKGGAGGVGFPQISELAAELEEAIRSGAEPAQLQERLSALVQTLGAVQVPGSKLDPGVEGPPEPVASETSPPEPEPQPSKAAQSEPAAAGGNALEALVQKTEAAALRVEEQTTAILAGLQRIEQLCEQLSEAKEEQGKWLGQIRSGVGKLLKELSAKPAS